MVWNMKRGQKYAKGLVSSSNLYIILGALKNTGASRVESFTRVYTRKLMPS